MSLQGNRFAANRRPAARRADRRSPDSPETAVRPSSGWFGPFTRSVVVTAKRTSEIEHLNKGNSPTGSEKKIQHIRPIERLDENLGENHYEILAKPENPLRNRSAKPLPVRNRPRKPVRTAERRAVSPALCVRRSRRFLSVVILYVRV